MWKTYNIKAKFLTALVPNSRNNHLGTRSRIPPLTKGSSTLAISIYDNSFAAMGPKLGTPYPEAAQKLDAFKSKSVARIVL